MLNKNVTFLLDAWTKYIASRMSSVAAPKTFRARPYTVR